MWLQRPSSDGGAERTCQEGCGSAGLGKKERKELVQSQAQVPGTEGKQALASANKPSTGRGGSLGLDAQDATEEEGSCLLEIIIHGGP